MGSKCFPIAPDAGLTAWFLTDEISPELEEGRSGLKPAGTADRVFVADLVFGTEDLLEEDTWFPVEVVADKLDVEPA